MFKGCTGCVLAGAGLAVMPLIGITIGLCIIGAGLIIAVITAEKAECKMQAAKQRELSQYPSYKY